VVSLAVVHTTAGQDISRTEMSRYESVEAEEE
jgi:hypothetical protein